jgi:hypothetical protein
VSREDGGLDPRRACATAGGLRQALRRETTRLADANEPAARLSVRSALGDHGDVQRERPEPGRFLRQALAAVPGDIR